MNKPTPNPYESPQTDSPPRPQTGVPTVGDWVLIVLLTSLASAAAFFFSCFGSFLIAVPFILSMTAALLFSGLCAIATAIYVGRNLYNSSLEKASQKSLDKQ